MPFGMEVNIIAWCICSSFERHSVCEMSAKSGLCSSVSAPHIL